MSKHHRICSQQLLQEAEGYLDLVTVFADRWPLSQPVRDRMAQCALDAIEGIDDSSTPRSKISFLRGQALLTMEQFAEAIEPLREACDLDENDVHVRLALGWCYKRVRRLDLAIESLEEALEIDPERGIVHYNLACYWSLANNPKLAVMYLSSALEIEPNYRDKLGDESDFDNVRHHPEFLALTAVIV